MQIQLSCCPVAGGVKKGMEVHAHNEESGPIIITGVESENIEEINDAYGDMITDMGETSKNNILARAVGVAVGCHYAVDWQQY